MKMKVAIGNSLCISLLAILQVYFLFYGSNYWGKIINPFLFFSISLSIPIFYLYQLRKKNCVEIDHGKSISKQAFIYSALAIIAVICSFEEVRKALQSLPIAKQDTDVLIQLEVMYNRFTNEIFPYTVVHEALSSPFPVYMPMHFIPIGICKLLHLDIRWSGFFVYTIASGLFGYYIGSKKIPNLLKIFLVCFPSITLWCYILCGNEDIFITFEVLIAAYYLILITGLLMRNVYLVFIGISLCILSRYTFIFWLPLFGLLFLTNKGLKNSLVFLISIIAVLFIGYIYPFYLKDTSIFSKGLAYHNQCAGGEWTGYFGTSLHGIHFAYLIKMLVNDPDTIHYSKGVFINRIIQAIVLLLTLCFGITNYYFKKIKPNFYKYSAAFLYLFLLVFFCFGPLTYRYYLIVLMTLSICLVAEMFILSFQRKIVSP
jgi:hypothetical protein